MTVEELLNRLKEIQDQLDEIEPGPDDAPLYDVQDLIYRLIQDVDELQDGQIVEPWTIGIPLSNSMDGSKNKKNC